MSHSHDGGFYEDVDYDSKESAGEDYAIIRGAAFVRRFRNHPRRRHHPKVSRSSAASPLSEGFAIIRAPPSTWKISSWWW